MDRPRTAHRRRHADSITVVDLIRRQNDGDGVDRVGHPPTAVVRIPEQRLAELLGPADTHQPPSRSSRFVRSAKIIGLMVGVMALCGSLVVAATLARHRPNMSVTMIPATLPTEVTGVDALRPDALANALAGRTAGASSRSGVPAASSPAAGAPTNGATRPSRHGATTGDGAAPAANPPPAAGPASASPTPSPSSGQATQQSAQQSAQQVVRSFFELVTTRPPAALALLDPSLLGSGRDGFVQSWSGVNQVTVESVRATSATAVQAVISLRLADGTLMRVVELLGLTSGNPPLINGADLLSAQRQ